MWNGNILKFTEDMDVKAIAGNYFGLMLIQQPRTVLFSSKISPLPGPLVLLIASPLFAEETHTFHNTAQPILTSKKLFAGHKGNFNILSCLITYFFLSRL